jgi:hypothetical protein
MYPKIKNKHTPKPKRNPKPTINDLCEVCGLPYAATHEIFFGEKYRKWSIKYGLTKRLCYIHHNMPSGVNPHSDRRIDLRYKVEAQRSFEQEHSHEDFIKIFGRNYLE